MIQKNWNFAYSIIRKNVWLSYNQIHLTILPMNFPQIIYSAQENKFIKHHQFIEFCKIPMDDINSMYLFVN